MIRYQIRTVALVNIVRDIKSKRLVPNAYFQRSLVWRDVHKREFIDTILMGYPFPQLFFSRGKIDVLSMSSTSCIVDGQQRSNAIVEYIDDAYAVNGRKFSDLSNDEKEAFLKYEIGVVELDLDNDDPRVREMFKRVNRTSNSLTAIEKLASEYGFTAFMLTAKVLADEVRLPEEESNRDDDLDGLAFDPEVDDSLFAWARSKKPKHYQKLISDGGIFSEYEGKRKVPLMYTLNIMSTMHSGFFRRNEATLTLLDDFKDDFPSKDEMVLTMEKSAITYTKFKFPKSSAWRNKANFFSLMVVLCQRGGEVTNIEQTAEALIAFEKQLPDDYALAAKEGVNNKSERELRHSYLKDLVV